MSFIEHILDGVQGVFHVNPSTLSGAIDVSTLSFFFFTLFFFFFILLILRYKVLVVKQADGTLKSTPFHVRFGKLQTLYPHEKVVCYFGHFVSCFDLVLLDRLPLLLEKEFPL